MSDAFTPKPRNPLPPEETIWRAHPSQWTNVGLYICVAIGILGIHLLLKHRYVNPYAVFKLVLVHKQFNLETLLVFGSALVMLALAISALIGFLNIVLTSYELTNQRMLITSLEISGLRRHEIELYRVFEYVLYQPFIWLPFGLGLIELRCNDPKQPFLYLRGIKKSELVLDHIRRQVEVMRDFHGVSDLNIHSN